MKDLPHHLKKLNRRVIRSEHRREAQEIDWTATRPLLTEHQRKKQAKAKIKQARMHRTPIHPTLEERNQAMKHRVPIFDSLSHNHPKTMKPSRKKRPPI